MAGGLTAGARAAERLLELKDTLATVLTDRLYAERPYLWEKHGQRGHDLTHQDMKYNIEHLAPAVALSAPAMFAGYVTWLDDLLRSRSVATTEVVRTLELIADECRLRLDPDEAEAVDACVSAGLRVLEASA